MVGCLFFIVTLKTYYRWATKLLKRQNQSYCQYVKDYTLEFALSRKQTEYFEENIYSKIGPEKQSYGEAYMESISKEVTDTLNRLFKEE